MKPSSWSRVLACVWALGACVTHAEPDTFWLGTGRDGALDLNTSMVINSYARVTAGLSPGTRLVPVSTTAGFSPGHLVMVLQTTGLSPEEASTGLNLTNSPVGRWELARVQSVSGTALTLAASLVHGYAAQVTQVIRVPEYTELNIRSAGILRAEPWNGSTGGVVAFLATGTVTNNGVITATGAGFRGGSFVPDPLAIEHNGCVGLDEPSPLGAQRGESLVPSRVGSTGRGRMAAGGGGGICRYSGGGGGGHGGAGGQGGATIEDSLEDTREVGGQGGGALTYPLIDHLALGGAGGAGQGVPVDPALEPHGGNGGGIVFFRARQLAGGGHVEANGSGGTSTTVIGAGGGGAGGSIVARLVESAVCGSMRARGGTGGNIAGFFIAGGPGGGGGGGRVLLQASDSTGCALDVMGGATGTAGTKRATAGVDGTVTRLQTGLARPSAPAFTAPTADQTVNTSRPTLSGTSVAGAQVYLMLEGVPLPSTTSDDSGGFTLTPAQALGDGRYSVTAAAEFEGIRGPASEPLSFSVDTQAPLVQLDSPAERAEVGTQQPTITGRAERGSTVTVFFDDVSSGSTTANASGTWSFTPSAPLDEGEHGVTAQATDLGQNTGPRTPERLFTVDVTAPAAPELLAPASGTVVGRVSLTYAGTAEPGSRVTVLIDGQGIGQTTARADSAWSLTVAEPPSHGDHSAAATAMDAAGNVSAASADVDFTVDGIPPAVPQVLAPVSGATVNTSRPTFSGTAEAGSRVSVEVDGRRIGEVTAGADGAWSVASAASLSETAHSLRAMATDAVGNPSDYTPGIEFTVDATAPDFAIITAPAQDRRVATKRPTFTGTAEALGQVTVVIDGVEFDTVRALASGAWSYTPATELEESSHDVQARVTDSAGNTRGLSSARAFVVDVTPPTSQVTTPADGASLATGTPLLSGTAEADSTVIITLDGVDSLSVRANGTGAWNARPSPPLPTGTHTLQVRAEDAAGNLGARSAMHTFSVDVDAPGAPVLRSPAEGALTNARTPTVTGIAEGGCLVTIDLDSVQSEVVANARGEWEYTPTESLGDGLHRVSARCSDALGNTSPFSSPRNFTVDGTAPLAPVFVSPTGGAVVGPGFSLLTGIAEPGTTVSVSLDKVAMGTATAGPRGDWSLPVGLTLIPGAHLLQAWVTDAARNTSLTSADVSFTVDATAPAAPTVTSPVADAVLGRSAFRIIGTAEPGATVTYSIDGAVEGSVVADETGAWSATLRASLADGPHALTARATDIAGNSGPVSSAVPFTVDTGAPQTSVSGGPEGTSNVRETTFTLSASENPVTFECALDGAPFAPCESPLTLRGLADGEHTLDVRATDAGGNVDATPARHTWAVAVPKDVEGGGVGCAAGGTGPLGVLGWLAWMGWLAARRRR